MFSVEKDGYTVAMQVWHDAENAEQQYNYEADGNEDIGEVLDGASKEGVIRFKGLDPDKGFNLTIGAYSDNWELDIEDYVFEIK